MAPRKFNKKGPKKSKSSKKTAPKKTQNFEKKVLQVIHKQQEDKEAYLLTNESSLISFNSGINSAGDCLQLIPPMTNGTGNYQRIGDKVQLKSHVIKGYYRIVPNLAAGSYKFGNVMVRMLVVSLKSASNYDMITSDPTLTSKLAGLLQKGGTTVGFTGQISDVMAPINRDLFTVHYDKVHNIKQDYVVTATGGITQDTLRMFNINLKVKSKVLKYSDDMSSGLLPTNYSPILLVGYSFADGSLPDTTSTNLQLYYESRIVFEDS